MTCETRSPLSRFLFDDRRGAVSVEWVTVTAALMITAIVFAYVIFSGGLDAIRQETNTDFNRVNTGAPSGGGGIEG